MSSACFPFSLSLSVRSNYKEGMKRSIKFNDIERSLSLDIKLPGSTKWHRVEPALARESKKAAEEAELDEIKLRPKKARIASKAPRVVTHCTTGPTPRPLSQRGGETTAGRSGASMAATSSWLTSAGSPDGFPSLDDSFGSTLRGESAASPSREETMEQEGITID